MVGRGREVGFVRRRDMVRDKGLMKEHAEEEEKKEKDYRIFAASNHIGKRQYRLGVS